MHAAALTPSAHPGKPAVFRLPALREELNLHPGPALASGEPSWTWKTRYATVSSASTG